MQKRTNRSLRPAAKVVFCIKTSFFALSGARRWDVGLCELGEGRSGSGSCIRRGRRGADLEMSREEERHFCQGLLTTGPADIITRHGLQKSLMTSIFV